MSIQSVTPQTVKEWMENDDVVFIDVREPAEYATAHIPNATLLPLGKIQADALPDSNKKRVLYCQKGARGVSACSKVLEQNADKQVYNLEGGFAAWQAAGLPTVEGKSNVIALDRQVQITIGSGVLAGSAAAYFINPMFVGIPAFFGAGLLFAGLTGTCGLALLIAKMPWNQSA